jgi:predicted nuclease of predicted toxin-antitoxin system
MKFLADMGISPKTVSFLRDLGHQAVHLHEEGLGRLSDSEILEKARREESIVLTHDLDFGDLLAASGAQLPAVVIFRFAICAPNASTSICRTSSHNTQKHWITVLSPQLLKEGYAFDAFLW